MPLPSTPAACTIVSPNYLAYARTLAASYLEHHPGHEFFVLLVADLSSSVPFSGLGFVPVLLNEIGLEDVRKLAMKYDILELNTNVKATFLKYLLKVHGISELIYLDPDIHVYSRLTPVFEALESHDAVLTPHITTPVYDGRSPSEQDLLFNGTYNLGFFGTRNTPGALRILDWWERRCLDLGFSEGRSGLFVDQKWMNLAPGLFDHVRILRHPGCNMAYWNLHERLLTQYRGLNVVKGPDGEAPLCFFHFSGIEVAEPASLSRNTDRFTLAQRPDLARLFAAYKARVLLNRDEEREGTGYGFDTFSDGTAITRLARRLYAEYLPHFPERDPFDSSGPWARHAVSQRLVDGKLPAAKSGWKDFSGSDRRVQWVHRLLRMALRRLGPNRYELLMRYLGHISILRNQSVFLNRKLP